MGSRGKRKHRQALTHECGQARSRYMRIRRTVLSAAAVVAVGLSSVVPVWAHHAFAAEFDANKPIKVTGTVTRVELTNPHSWIHLNVKGPDGQVEEWMFEGGSPGALARRGF